MLDGNLFAGANIINFAIPGEGLHTITPRTELPAITATLTIDGSTQAGYSGTPLIELDGSSVPAPRQIGNLVTTASGLTVSGTKASQSVIRGLWIHDFAEAQIRISGNSGKNEVVGCYLGFGPDFSQGRMEKAGVWVRSGYDNVIGGTSIAEVNVIGGAEAGVLVQPQPMGINDPRDFPDLGRTSILGNLIGLKPGGSEALPNNYGIRVIHGADTYIGGGYRIPTPEGRNVISANTVAGISIEGEHSTLTLQQTVLHNNFIGIDITGSKVPGTQANGIVIDGASGVVIGTGSPSNFISGNTGAGIRINDLGVRGERTTSVGIYGNYIGTDTTGTQPLGNGGDGIRVEAKASAGSVHFYGNIISANSAAGIAMFGSDSGQAVKIFIDGNRIGTDKTGTKPLGNAVGILADHIGSLTTNSNFPHSVNGNIISGNVGDGIRIIYDSTSSAISLGANFIGTDSTGKQPLGNGGNGIHASGSFGRVDIGYSGGGNLISANRGDGILFENDSSELELTIASNFIGTSVNGMAAMGNQGAGIHLARTSLASVIIGGETQPPGDFLKGPGDGNIVSGNLSHGILLDHTPAAKVMNNYVGVASTGRDMEGLGNGGDGIHLGFGADYTVINGNTIGGAVETFSINLENANEALIVSNHVSGSAIITGGSSRNTFQNNFITVQATGIRIVSGTENTLSQNTIVVDPGGLPIDLGGDGPTPNDKLDADEGGNHLQNAPVLHSAAVRGGMTLVRGKFEGAPLTATRLELFEDNMFVQSIDVFTDAQGKTQFRFDLAGGHIGAVFSATATAAGNTSELAVGVLSTIPPEVNAIGAKIGATPRVQLVDASTGETLVDVMAYARSFRGGVHVATGDVNGDGFHDLIVAPGPGMKPQVKVFSGLDGELITNFMAGSISDVGSRTLASGDLDGDGTPDLILGQASAIGSYIGIYDSLTGIQEQIRTPFGQSYTGRIQVKLKDLDGDTIPEIIARGEVGGRVYRATIDPA